MNATKDESGQATVLTLGIFLVVFGVVAFAVDGTRAFVMRRTLQNAADAAVLAGASELDRTIYYESGGARIELDPKASEEVARSYLAHRGIDAKPRITVTQRAIRVELRGSLQATFLNVIGVRNIPVTAAAEAEPLSQTDL
jgi:Putative Flp pilus-assembly TadE/G-like